jgi:hypothetical protein
MSSGAKGAGHSRRSEYSASHAADDHEHRAGSLPAVPSLFRLTPPTSATCGRSLHGSGLGEGGKLESCRDLFSKPGVGSAWDRARHHQAAWCQGRGDGVAARGRTGLAVFRAFQARSAHSPASERLDSLGHDGKHARAVRVHTNRRSHPRTRYLPEQTATQGNSRPFRDRPFESRSGRWWQADVLLYVPFRLARQGSQGLSRRFRVRVVSAQYPFAVGERPLIQRDRLGRPPRSDPRQWRHR